MAGNFLAKTVGLAALGIAGYDTIQATKREASRHTQQDKLAFMHDTFLRTDSVGSESETANKLQNWAKNWSIDHAGFFGCAPLNYAKSFVCQLFDNIGTIALGTAALLCGAKGSRLSPIKIPYVNKIAAVLLAIGGGKFILSNLFGVASSNPEKLDVSSPLG